ncbi:MAG: hypothetical protein WAM51_06365, partial [Methylovirgula sp.]
MINGAPTLAKRELNGAWRVDDVSGHDSQRAGGSDAHISMRDPVPRCHCLLFCRCRACTPAAAT